MKVEINLIVLYCIVLYCIHLRIIYWFIIMIEAETNVPPSPIRPALFTVGKRAM